MTALVHGGAALVALIGKGLGVVQPGQGRVPVWKSHGTIRKQWLGTLVLVDALYGAANLFGGKAEAPTQVLLKDITDFNGAVGLWGFALMTAAVLIWIGYSLSGAFLGVLCWGLLMVLSGFTVLRGTALSLGGPFLLAYVTANHMWVVHEVKSGIDAENERKQRG